MIYDDIDLSHYMLVDCKRPLMPAPSVSTQTAVGKDGFDVGSVVLRSFSVEAKCTILPDSPLTIAEGVFKTDELKRRIAALLFRREKCKLFFDEDPTRYCMAIVTNVSNVTRTAYVDQCTITFLCDPYFYSQSQTVSIPAGNSSVYIDGTLPARPLFTITPSLSKTSIQLTNVDTGEFLKVNASIPAVSVLRIDMQARRATVNGADLAVTLGSDFFELAPGNNNLSLTSGCTATMTYEGAWL